MAHLKIETPEGSRNAAAVHGNTARCWLNDVEISSFVSGIEVTVPVDGPIQATLHIYVGKLELALAANMTLAVPEVRAIIPVVS